jgi:hypothetical protein
VTPEIAIALLFEDPLGADMIVNEKFEPACGGACTVPEMANVPAAELAGKQADVAFEMLTRLPDNICPF